MTGFKKGILERPNRSQTWMELTINLRILATQYILFVNDWSRVYLLFMQHRNFFGIWVVHNVCLGKSCMVYLTSYTHILCIHNVTHTYEL